MSESRPPAHLSAASKRWWKQIASEYVLEPHHVRLLTAAAESWDRMVAARREIESRGLLVVDRFNVPKTNPAVNIERDCRLAFARIVRELDLDVAPAPEIRRVVGRR